ncbi:MAG: GDSL-type esterase/lipase family protein [Minisyncoccia bacterium]
MIIFAYNIYISKHVVRSAQKFSLEGTQTEFPILVLGDSTAVGVGADTKDGTLAGRIAHYTHSGFVENYAQSGARTRDLSAQVAKAQLSEYALILIQIGGNDIIRFQSATKTAKLLENLHLPVAHQVLVVSAGNVGGTTFFPFFMRPYYTRENMRYHAHLKDVCDQLGYTYVNLFVPKNNDVFILHPDIYLSADGLHPSSAGYAIWFEIIRPFLKITH